MEIRVVSETITEEEIKALARGWFGDLLKGAIDTEREIVALGGEYHIDAQEALCEDGSRPQSIWGFNLLVDEDIDSDAYIEFTSLINIRPAEGNRSLELKDENLKRKIKEIIRKIIVK